MGDPGSRRARRRREKARVRDRVQRARDELPPAMRRAASLEIARRLAELPAVNAARVVFCFVPFRSEVDTLPFIEHALAGAKTVAAPRVTGPHRMEAFRIDDPAGDLEPGTWGIPEPRPECRHVGPAEIDVVIVPGMAFDTTGARIGYGGGYYDSYFPRLRSGVPRVAVCFDLQVVDRVPRGRYDLCVDTIVTERRVIRTAPRARPPSLPPSP
jgi:5-formyltetrahydrofolate cyclo-ligase